MKRLNFLINTYGEKLKKINNNFLSHEDSIEKKILKIATFDPTENKQYTQWIINNLIEYPDFNFDTITNHLDIFFRLNKHLDKNERDINQYSVYEFIKKNQPLIKIDEKNKEDERFKNKIDNETVYYEKNKELCVVIPKTWEASKFWGQQTKWCTAQESSDRYFKSYTNVGELFIFILNNGKKYQFWENYSSKYFDFFNSKDIKFELKKEFNTEQLKTVAKICLEKNINFFDVIKDDVDNIYDYYNKEDILKILLYIERCLFYGDSDSLKKNAPNYYVWMEKMSDLILNNIKSYEDKLFIFSIIEIVGENKFLKKLDKTFIQNNLFDLIKRNPKTILLINDIDTPKETVDFAMDFIFKNKDFYMKNKISFGDNFKFFEMENLEKLINNDLFINYNNIIPSMKTEKICNYMLEKNYAPLSWFPKGFINMDIIKNKLKDNKIFFKNVPVEFKNQEFLNMVLDKDRLWEYDWNFKNLTHIFRDFPYKIFNEKNMETICSKIIKHNKKPEIVVEMLKIFPYPIKDILKNEKNLLLFINELPSIVLNNLDENIAKMILNINPDIYNTKEFSLYRKNLFDNFVENINEESFKNFERLFKTNYQFTHDFKNDQEVFTEKMALKLCKKYPNFLMTYIAHSYQTKKEYSDKIYNFYLENCDQNIRENIFRLYMKEKVQKYNIIEKFLINCNWEEDFNQKKYDFLTKEQKEYLQSTFVKKQELKL